MFKHILIPLDGSEMAESAIPAAAYLANSLKTQVTLLHVIEKNAPEKIHGQRHLVNEADACQYLSDIAEKRFSSETKIHRHVHSEVVEKVSASIVQHSDEFTPDLIVMCAHGKSGLHDFMVGSIAQQVIAAGSVPVLLVRPGSNDGQFEGFHKILVALDGNSEHESGFEITAELAVKLKSELHLIQVVPTLSTLSAKQSATGTLLPATTAALLEIDEDMAAEYLEEKISFLNKKRIRVTAEVQRGDPAKEVVQSANVHDSQLIVLGTHGKSGLNAFWTGSVAPKIVEQTTLPILLVPVRR